MYILAFDTSFEHCGVAIARDELLLSIDYSKEPFSHTEQLVPMIEKALNKVNIDYKDLSYLAVNKGPGSFTGIRAGLAAAQSIVTAVPHVVPVTLNSFNVVRWAAKDRVKAEVEAVIFRATASTAYIQVFTPAGQPLSEPMTLPQNEIAGYLKQFKGVISCCGNMPNELYPLLDNVIFLPYYKVPSVRALCKFALEQIRKQHIDSDLNPLYIAAPSAQANAAI